MQMQLRLGCAGLAIALMLGAGLPARGDDMATDVLWVEGMTLPDCDDVGLELLLESVPGVDRVTVDFHSGRTDVAYDPQQLTRDELIAEINNRGFEVPWVTDTFLVGWNDARRDAPAVRLLIGSLPGVAEVVVDDSAATASIRYEPARVSRQKLVAEMSNLDWEMTLRPTPPAPAAR